MRLPSVALIISLIRSLGRNSSLSIFAIVDKGDTVSVFGKVGVLVTADLEPETLVLFTRVLIDSLRIIPTGVSMSRSGKVSELSLVRSVIGRDIKWELD
jgi:hypothetical protein